MLATWISTIILEVCTSFCPYQPHPVACALRFVANISGSMMGVNNRRFSSFRSKMWASAGVTLSVYVLLSFHCLDHRHSRRSYYLDSCWKHSSRVLLHCLLTLSFPVASELRVELGIWLPIPNSVRFVAEFPPRFVDDIPGTTVGGHKHWFYPFRSNKWGDAGLRNFANHVGDMRQFLFIWTRTRRVSPKILLLI